jgi:hypothetical protein
MYYNTSNWIIIHFFMSTPIKKQSIKDIDLDITHYDTDELLAMLNLRDPSEDDIINATNRLINKANADRLPKVADFFQQAQDTLLDELDKQDPPQADLVPAAQQEDPAAQQEDPDQEDADQQEDPDQEDQDQQEDPDADPAPEDDAMDDPKSSSNQLGQWWRNEYLKQADKVQADKTTDRKNKIQVLQGNRHMPTKREKLGVNETYQVPVAQGTLNPNLKNTINRLVNIDSQYRQIITPNSENPLGPASPTNYTLDLTENLTNVLSIKLNSIQIPFSWYAIDITSGTNVLFYRQMGVTTPYTPFTITPGNYTPAQLQAYMNPTTPSTFSSIFNTSFNAVDGKMTITNVSATPYTILFFDPTYRIPYTALPGMNAQEINDAIAASKVNSNLGWLMGYRGTNQVPVVPNKLIYDFPINFNIWVAGGNGTGTNPLAYSLNGIDWTASANGNTIFGQCESVAWNGRMWVAGGSGINTIAYSYDGKTWNPSANGNSLFSICTTVAWNGFMWVAGGNGTNPLAYSLNGIDWTASANGAAIFGTVCNSVAWNGSMWVACGNAGAGLNVLGRSSDGTNWTASANGNLMFTLYAHTVAWNGTNRWVAGGAGTQTLAYSPDGNTWTASANGNSMFGYCESVAWNGSNRWVAGGSGATTLAYSPDGNTWTASFNGISVITNYVYSVAWNGSSWVAGGFGTNTLAYSSDGNTWTASANGNSLFSNVLAVNSSSGGYAVTAEALADTYGPKYILLVLDDYNQNHLNKGLVTIATNDTRLSLPSYFNPGIAVTCDASGNPTYVQSAPRQLTQAQLYSINAINQNRNNTTIDRYTGPTTTDVLALIPVKTNSLQSGQPYTEFGSSMQINERVYFGPVNIERMKVQLVDDKGNILNLHGNDWCFTLATTHLYEY